MHVGQAHRTSGAIADRQEHQHADGGGKFPWGVFELMAIPAVGGGLMAWMGHSPAHNINDRVRFVGDVRISLQELANATDASTLGPTVARLRTLAARTSDADSLQVGFKVARSAIRHAGESLGQAANAIERGDLTSAQQSVSWVNGFMSQGVNAEQVDRYLVDSQESIHHTSTFEGTGPEEIRAAGKGFFARMAHGQLTTAESLTIAGGLFAAFVGGTVLYSYLRDDT